VRLQIAAIASVAIAVLVAAPLVGWPPVVRLPAVLLPAIVVAVLVLRPWRWSESDWNALERWQPSRRELVIAAIAVALLLFWFVLTRFESAQINAVDFTVYFDRPCNQTVHQGRPLFVERADLPSFSNRSQLAVHAFWAMLPVCTPYAIFATPYWLLILSVVVVVAGSVRMFRIGGTLRWSGPLAAATALASLLNDNMARTLNGGFHAEVLDAWLVPWLLDAGTRRARASYLAAALACVLVKEDAWLMLFAAAVCLMLVRGEAMTHRDRILFLVLPTAIAVLNFLVFYRIVVPALTPDGNVTYAAFWSNYGPTPMQAIVAMASHPWRVLEEVATSGFFPTVMMPHLLLPLIGWRWSIGTAPIVTLYGASANPQLRAFGIYYSIVLLPFLTLAASSGALTITGWLNLRRASIWAAAIVVVGAVLVGSSHRGYSLRRWRPEVAATGRAVSLLVSEHVVLVQSAIYPHAGYAPTVQLLTPESLHDAQNSDAVLLIAPALSGYPLGDEDIRRLAHLPVIRPMPDGLLAVRPNP
jgi:uncharacterized membrane protein